jgi:hypothetical protein
MGIACYPVATAWSNGKPVFEEANVAAALDRVLSSSEAD